MRNIFRKKKKSFPKVFAYTLLVIVLNIILLTENVFASEITTISKPSPPESIVMSITDYKWRYK